MSQQLRDRDINYIVTPIICDINISAINITKNYVQYSRTKHADVRHHFIRDHAVKGGVSLEFIPTVKKKKFLKTLLIYSLAHLMINNSASLEENLE